MEIESLKSDLESEDDTEPEPYCPGYLEFEGILDQITQFALMKEQDLLPHIKMMKQKNL